jgi:hypothetical protein
MKTNVKTALFFAVAMFAAPAFAAVVVDEDGNGFVGKGDVQSVFDWNNSMLQDNAYNISFRYIAGGTATWHCIGTNPAGHVVISTDHEATFGINSGVAYDPRKNKTGQVTGFNLSGFTTDTGDTVAIGSCPVNQNWQVQRTMVEGSLNFDGSVDPILQVSNDGDIWHDLAITY